MRKNILISLFLIIFVASILGYLLYFNNPPQGASFDSIEIVDSEVKYYENNNGTYTVEVNGTIFFQRVIPENPYDPTSFKINIDVKTNETLGINRKNIASKTMFINMSFKEKYPIDEKLFIFKDDSYIVTINVFALQPNNFWGTHWEAIGKEYIYIQN